MPPVAAGAVLSAVFAGSAITAAGVLTVGFSWAAFAGSLILGGLSYALTPKPKNSASQFAASSETPGTVAVRQSDLTRTYIYGHTRAVRGYAHMESTNNNKDLHLILMLCEGPLRAINEVWVDDYAIPNDWLDVDGNVTQGRYKDFMQIRKHLGGPDQDADSLAVTNLTEWTVDHRLRGIAYLYIIMNKSQDVYPTGVPNITAIVEGPTVYDPRTSGQIWSTNMALASYDFISTQKGFAAQDADTDLTNISAQANICDEIVDTTHEDFNSTAIDAVTNIITFTGDLLTLQYGDRVRVSTGGTLPSGISAGTDYYVIPYQIKDTPRIKLATSLDNAMASNPVALGTTGTGGVTVTKTGEPRYHGSGIVDSSGNLSDTLSNLVSSMAGRAINIAGKWTLLAGAWRTPVVDFGIGDMRGSGISFKNCLSMSDSYNVIKGLFSGAPTLYQDSDYPSVRYDTFVTQDLNIEATKELNLPFTTRPTTAQRIAKIEMFRGRQDITVTCDFSMKAMQVQPGDIVTLTVERLGWDEKEFEVTTFAFDATENGLVIKMGLRETAEEIYDWTNGEAIDYDPAPNTSLPNPYIVSVPTGVGYNSRFIQTQDGDAIYTLQLEWDLHPDAFVREYGDFELQFKLNVGTTDDDYSPGYFVDGHLTHTDVVTASVGERYDLRIRARNNIGVRSNWVTIVGATVGASGGVVVTEDYLLITGSPTVFLDYGLITASATSFEDFGYVA